jgi:excinuclease ABC subunit B
LRITEFEQHLNQVVYVSATPADTELQKSMGIVVEQVIRPTGLIDPPIQVKPAKGQVEDAIDEIRARVALGDRVLVTTLTKRMSEDLSEYLQEIGVKAKYLHSDIDAIQRTEIIRDLRLGHFDVLVGINLLREGLDLPEVSLVIILDADKEGFLRGRTALIQTCGRAARNVNGVVIMYADVMTDAIRRTIDETQRRREKQLAFNTEHGITPQSIKKNITNILDTVYEADYSDVPIAAEPGADYIDPAKIPGMIEQLRKEMRQSASKLEFEKAAILRDRILSLEQQFLSGGGTVPSSAAGSSEKTSSTPKPYRSMRRQGQSSRKI